MKDNSQKENNARQTRRTPPAPRPLHPETLALHAGHTPDPETGSRAVPLYRTAAYLFEDSAQAAARFSLEEEGPIYTRIGNPTQEILETRLAQLEGGTAAVAVASGTAAIFYAVLNLAGQGDEIIAASNLYGGTHTLFTHTLPGLGITVRFIPPNSIQALNAALTPRTKAVYTETIGNPGLEVADIPGLAQAAHSAGLPLLADATFSTPLLQRPLDQGADIVIHSLTKWIGGHGTVLGGAVIDGGRFDWTRQPDRYPGFNQPDPSYHGIRWAHDLGPQSPQAYALRLRTVLLRNTGAAISPDNAWQILQGLETLPLRMERHCQNTLAAAQYLAQHPRAAWVRYPGLPTDPAYPLAQELLPRGAGGMVVFGIQGENAPANTPAEGPSARQAGQDFIEKLQLFSHLANVGDAKSLAIHPASTTHAQLSPEEQTQAGVAPELIRLSIGLEHIDDILADLDQALQI